MTMFLNSDIVRAGTGQLKTSIRTSLSDPESMSMME